MLSIIEQWIGHSSGLSALGFFLGSLLEEILPSPGLLTAVGLSLFADGGFSLGAVLKFVGIVAVPIIIGSTLGSIVFFGLGHWGGKIFIDKFSKWLGFSWQDVEKLRARLSLVKSDEWILFLTRCIPFGPTKIFNIAAGLIRMNFATFTFLVLCGMVVKTLLLFLLVIIFGNIVT